MTNVICGVLNKRKKFHFSFDTDSKLLTITPIKMNNSYSYFFDDINNNYPYFRDYVDIDGETNLGTYIKFINIKFSNVGRGCLQAYVPAYIVGTICNLSRTIKPNHIRSIIYKGKCIDLFYNPTRVIKKRYNDETGHLNLDINPNSQKIVSFTCGKYEYSFFSDWVMKSRNVEINNPLNIYSNLVVSSKEDISIKKIISNYLDVEKFFSFVCNRQHVIFDRIILRERLLLESAGVKEWHDIDFELYISEGEKDIDLPSNNHTLVYKNEYIRLMPKLINTISKKDFIKMSFPINSQLERILDVDKFKNVSSAFEENFSDLYPNFKSNRKKNYNVVKNDILSYINIKSNNYEYNRDQRKYFKRIYKFVDELEGLLEEEIKYALNEFSYIVDNDIQKYKSSIEDNTIDIDSLSTSFANKRNQLSHGTVLEKFTDIEDYAYLTLKKINYAMLLKISNFSEDEIKIIVNNIYN